METFIFDLQLFDGEGGGGTPPDGEGGGGTPPDGEGGGDNTGGGGTSSSEPTTRNAAKLVTTEETLSGSYTSTTPDENAILISTTSTVVLNDVTVTKSGDSDGGDDCNFYGINSAKSLAIVLLSANNCKSKIKVSN